MRQKKSPQEIYLDGHRKCGIKVGDKVKVRRKCESFEKGWDTSWVNRMDDSVGMIGIVIRDEEDLGFALNFEDRLELSGFCFPYFAIQKVVNNKEKVITRTCDSQEEARALASFLWNEKQRHLDDIRIIDEDLVTLSDKWGVRPTKVKTFVRP